MKVLILLFSLVNAQDIVPVVNPNVYTDSDGDQVTILDSEIRSKLNKVKSSDVSVIYDNKGDLESFKKNIETKVLTKNKVKYGIYRVKAGDQLKRISQKIYGTQKRWTEITALNEEALARGLQPGMKLKYVLDPTVKDGKDE